MAQDVGTPEDATGTRMLWTWMTIGQFLDRLDGLFPAEPDPPAIPEPLARAFDGDYGPPAVVDGEVIESHPMRVGYQIDGELIWNTAFGLPDPDDVPPPAEPQPEGETWRDRAIKSPIFW